LIGYVGALSQLAIVGIQPFDQLPAAEAVGLPPPRAAARLAQLRPGARIGHFDLPEKTYTYDVLRRPEGGRKT
jgi:hypothetical protein